MIGYRTRLQGKVRPRDTREQKDNEKHPSMHRAGTKPQAPCMMTPPQKNTLEKQMEGGHKEMGKAQMRLRELHPKVMHALHFPTEAKNP